MGQQMAARNGGGGGDPFDDPRMQGMQQDVNVLRAGNDAAKVAAGLIRRGRLKMLNGEVDRLARKAKKKRKAADDAIALVDPTNSTATQAEYHDALVALRDAQVAEHRVNQAQSDVDTAMAEGETWRAIDGAVGLADDLGVGRATASVSGGAGTALQVGALALGATALLEGTSPTRGRRRR